MQSPMRGMCGPSPPFGHGRQRSARAAIRSFEIDADPLLRSLLLALAGARRLRRTNYVPKAEPSFYRNLAQPGAELDAAAAASMISGYRANNGLAAVTLDPELMRLAEAQAEAMAKRDKLDHNVGKPFVARLKASGYDAKTRGGEHRRRLSHAGGGVLRLARFAAAPRQHAAQGRDPHGHRRGLHADARNTRSTGR